jgi:glucosamine kinase
MKNISIYYFCVDGGGTKSNAALYDLNGKVLAKSSIDSGNIYNDVNKVVDNINILWSNCCSRAKLNKNLINFHTVASFGLAGARYQKSRRYLNKKLNFFKKIIISTDGHIALAAASTSKSVGVLNIGTGVVAHFMNKDKISQQISGWGFPYGDKGGGWWIGLRMVQATLRAIDGYNNDRDIIVKKTLNIIGNKDLKILNWISRSESRKLAKLSKVFFSVKSKSFIHNTILKEGVDEIEMILKYMIEEKKIRKIFLLGSISKFYINYIQKKYLKYLINEEINPLLGALRIAKKNFPLEVLINDKKNH